MTLDAEIFEESRYFDCFIEYAKASSQDILVKITVHNRGPESHIIHVLPHIWFRNFWKHNPKFTRPLISKMGEGELCTKSKRNGEFHYYHEGGSALLCENETNNERIYGFKNSGFYVKDGINDHVVAGASSVNPKASGTKAAIWYSDEIESGGSRVYRTRLSKRKNADPWGDFNEIFEVRKIETDIFYNNLTPKSIYDDQKALLRNALGGLLWTKQYYYLDA
jgi:hypothetical protein